jgi:hypothetical protein
MRGLVRSLIGIVVAGGTGGFAGWGAVRALGWSGVGGAVVAVVIGMVVALATFAALVVLADRLNPRP